MEILNFLKDNPHLIAFDNIETINNANIAIKDNHLTFNKGNEFFVFLDNFDKFNSLNFEIKKEQDINIYLITYQSRKIEIDYNFELQEKANLKIFTIFSSRRNTLLDVNLKFNLAKDAKLTILNALTFNGEVKFNETVNLNGLNATVDIDLLNVGGKTSKYYVNQDVFHNEKATISNIDNWLIATDQAKLAYSVSGSIKKGKEFSKCRQSNKGIMLSDNCEIMVEPKLFIDEYNVEASHGAAIGQMDELQLYYLLSRGLTENDARSLIISGYTNPFISLIDNKEIAAQLTSQISRLIRRKTYNE
ncbi:MAG: SufD family Fe-S cluster assembly protein [Candidatus Izemoplasmatales bacterium]|nr:SufD family Fe-S cluster assembly protein [Candidatus Izemoplasmatales bacterium]